MRTCVAIVCFIVEFASWLLQPDYWKLWPALQTVWNWTGTSRCYGNNGHEQDLEIETCHTWLPTRSPPYVVQGSQSFQSCQA